MGTDPYRTAVAAMGLDTDRRRDLVYTPAGEVVQIEQPMAVGALPVAVRQDDA